MICPAFAFNRVTYRTSAHSVRAMVSARASAVDEVAVAEVVAAVVAAAEAASTATEAVASTEEAPADSTNARALAA